MAKMFSKRHNWIKKNRINLLMLTAAGHLLNIAWVVACMKYGSPLWTTFAQAIIMLVLWYVLIKLENFK